MTMSSKTRVEMGLMAGVLATVVMTIAIIVATSISSALGYPWQIQWYTWIRLDFRCPGALRLRGRSRSCLVHRLEHSGWAHLRLRIPRALCVRRACSRPGSVVRCPTLPRVLDGPPAHGHPADDVLHRHRRAPHPARSLLRTVGPGDGARRQKVRRVRYCLAKPQNTQVRCDAS